MREDKRLDVKIVVEITDNGTPFSSNTTTWEDVPYIGVLGIQKKMVEFLNGMVDMGYEQWSNSLIENPTEEVKK